MNGVGYPITLEEDLISIEAKNIGLSDVVEALSSHRPNRPALGLDAALAEIKKNKGVLFDSAIVDAFIGAIKKNRNLISPS
jgi:HD-GYP domain-containing protein (c-di-GMP phosphodiesterase class II)